jgi:hypothetical protein
MVSFRWGGVSHKNRADKAGRGGITFKRVSLRRAGLTHHWMSNLLAEGLQSIDSLAKSESVFASRWLSKAVPP